MEEQKQDSVVSRPAQLHEVVQLAVKSFGIEKFVLTCLRANGEVLVASVNCAPFESISMAEIMKEHILKSFHKDVARDDKKS